VDGRYSVPLKAFLEDHPPTCKMGTLSLSGIKLQWRIADCPDLYSSENVNSLELFSRLPSVPARVCHGVTFTFYFEWNQCSPHCSNSSCRHICNAGSRCDEVQVSIPLAPQMHFVLELRFSVHYHLIGHCLGICTLQLLILNGCN